MRVYGLLLVAILGTACSETAKPVRMTRHEAWIEMAEALSHPITEAGRESDSYAALKIPACEELILRWKIPGSGNPKCVVIRGEREEFVEPIAKDQSTLAIGGNNSDLPDTRFFEVVFAEDYYVTKRTKTSSSAEMGSPRLFLRVLIETAAK